MNITDLVFDKKELEEIYKTTLTNYDMEIINNKLRWFTYADIVHDTKLFENTKEYAKYIYEDLDGYKYLIDKLIHISNKEPDAMYKISDLLVDNKDIKLSNGKYILVMD
ncbi:hypothetical protein [Staphylococcus equorum]|uniref:Uncharacterized protein n=1 Tax=Staphylococcus equorum TaxID=246432 RepID=A0A9X4LC90_9STAP|nr:hypothetical protein [Staphylococcus equorum]MDG0860344.1 hypothetical protein [Staphylococcus equorum]